MDQFVYLHLKHNSSMSFLGSNNLIELYWLLIEYEIRNQVEWKSSKKKKRGLNNEW